MDLIAAAIRAAVAEEREAIRRFADNLYGTVGPVRLGSSPSEAQQAVFQVIEFIRARA